MNHDYGTIAALLVVVFLVASILIGLAVVALSEDRHDKKMTQWRQKMRTGGD